MTPAPHSPEHDLSQTLARQADRFADAGGSPLELGQVLSRAGEIRRGRRMRATMVMAAVVLAVAVPVGITSLVDNDPKAPSVATVPDTSSIGLTGLESGAPPKTGYAYNDRLYGPDGEIPLGAGGTVVDIARLNNGFLVARANRNGDGSTVRFVADDGTASTAEWPYEGGFAIVAGGGGAAFMGTNSTVHTVKDGGVLYFGSATLPTGESYQIDAVGGENCTRPASDLTCTVYVHSNSENQRVWSISPEGAVTKVLPDFIALNDISTDGLFAGMTSASDTGSCSKVLDSKTATSLWHTCDYSFLSFSPDNRYLLARQAYGDGPGDGQLAILDARTGYVVLDLNTTRDAFMNGQRWEDDAHVLVSLAERGKSAIVRFALDGHREYATETASETEDFISPFKLG